MHDSARIDYGRVAQQSIVACTYPSEFSRVRDGYGDFLVRVVCECGVSPEIQPQAFTSGMVTLARRCSIQSTH
jgi:hypothetical protein